MTATAKATAAGPGAAPAVGFIGWGPESAAMLEVLRRRFPDIDAAASALAGAAGPPPPARTLPSLEGLFQAARLIFVEGGRSALDPHLAMVRLAISDRHWLVLLGDDWSVEELLGHLKERKLARCMLLPTAPDTLGSLAYYATPFFPPQELAAFRELFSHLELCVPLQAEAHFEVLRGLADFAPAAFFTVLEALADGVVMMGFPRRAAMGYLASVLHGAAGRLLEPGSSAALLREQALESRVAAAGLIELEAAGIRGTLMRAIQRAVTHARPETRRAAIVPEED
jgi:pyrroline-5-carboxylate reductase